MLVLDLHSWKHRVEEVLNVLERLLLVDQRQHLIELVKVGSDEVQLFPAVEAAHLGSSLVDGFGRVDICYLLPDESLGSGLGNKGCALLSGVLGDI